VAGVELPDARAATVTDRAPAAAPYEGPMARLRFAAAQLNTIVGDLDGNVERIVGAMKQAEADHCDIVAFPELTITGYPPEDLVLKPSFVADNLAALDRVAQRSGSAAAFVGFVDHDGQGRLVNAVAVCADGEIKGRYHKRHLPNYAVFDEERYFEPGSDPLRLYRFGDLLVGVSICEDAWFADGPIRQLADGGADLVVNLNASPFHRGKVREREAMLADRAAEADCAIAYVNLVGGQDELVFDGASLIVAADGSVITRAPQYEELVFVTDLDIADRSPQDATLPVVDLRFRAGGAEAASTSMATTTEAARVVVTAPAPLLDDVAEVYDALVLGTRDYVTKNGFSEVVIGLSGGVDSSLVAAIAADALGPGRVHGVLMPSRYSSDHSITDAEALANNLGVDHRTITIEPAHDSLLGLLAPSFADHEPDLTEENIQSRIRGVLLMALSNKFGWMVLTTSNKSESAVGYSTLYGDSAGGYAVIKDVPKLLVYELCRLRNEREGFAVIPEHVLTKPPSAELRPDQTDNQSLPDYEVLDPIIEAYVEQDRTVGDLIADGSLVASPEDIRRICRLVDLAEYKRRQFPPGPRITTKAFGKDRRLPITNRYRG
jgi:NAD+ synthase (glutamine-hydrolysing)